MLSKKEVEHSSAKIRLAEASFGVLGVEEANPSQSVIARQVKQKRRAAQVRQAEEVSEKRRSKYSAIRIPPCRRLSTCPIEN